MALKVSAKNLVELLRHLASVGGTMTDVQALITAVTELDKGIGDLIDPANLIPRKSLVEQRGPFCLQTRIALGWLKGVVPYSADRVLPENHRIREAADSIAFLVRSLTWLLSPDALPMPPSIPPGADAHSAHSASAPQHVNPRRMDRAALTMALNEQTVKVLRAIWSRTLRPQEEVAYPANSKSAAVEAIAGYFLDWHQGDRETFEEILETSKEFGADSTSIRQIRRQNQD